MKIKKIYRNNYLAPWGYNAACHCLESSPPDKYNFHCPVIADLTTRVLRSLRSARSWWNRYVSAPYSCTSLLSDLRPRCMPKLLNPAMDAPHGRRRTWSWLAHDSSVLAPPLSNFDPRPFVCYQSPRIDTRRVAANQSPRNTCSTLVMSSCHDWAPLVRRRLCGMFLLSVLCQIYIWKVLIRTINLFFKILFDKKHFILILKWSLLIFFMLNF